MTGQKKNPAPVAADAGKRSQRDHQNRIYHTTTPTGTQALSGIPTSEIPAIEALEAAERERRQKRPEAWKRAVTRLEVEFEASQGGGRPACLAGLSPEERLHTLRALGFRVLRRFTIDGALLGQDPQWEPCVYLSGGLFVNLADGWVNRRCKP